MPRFRPGVWVWARLALLMLMSGLLAQVLNKYYPPDFDPELLPRNKKPRDRQIEVRIMIPFTLCCSTCKEFSYRGKKFNSKKEIAQDIDYLGLHIHRFQPYFLCCRC